MNLNSEEFQVQNYDISTFNIQAYIVTEDIIEKIISDNTYVYNKNLIKRKIEIDFSMAKILLEFYLL